MLASCDRGTPVGERDHAILLLLARLGLRAGEVVALTLDDLDWERGEILVRGKGQRLGRLPLTTDVGLALVDVFRVTFVPSARCGRSSSACEHRCAA